MMALGERAPAPMSGETLTAYRLRLVRPLQRFSKGGFDKVKLDDLKGATAFDAVETKIYADAEWSAKHEPEVIPGVLREIIRADPSVRRVSTVIHITGGLPGEPQHAAVDGVLVKRAPQESMKNFEAHPRSLVKKGSVIVIDGLPD
jgi:hypothetical protein